MSREIKFEYIIEGSDGEIHRCPYTLDQLEESSVLASKRLNGRVIARRQYTGLRDHKGVEIYEGDIVRKSVTGQCGVVLWFAPTYAGYIIFHPKRSYVPGDWDGTYNKLDGRYGAFGDTHQLEVVGNIHEHPDLLEAAS